MNHPDQDVLVIAPTTPDNSFKSQTEYGVPPLNFTPRPLPDKIQNGESDETPRNCGPYCAKDGSVHGYGCTAWNTSPEKETFQERAERLYAKRDVATEEMIAEEKDPEPSYADSVVWGAKETFGPNCMIPAFEQFLREKLEESISRKEQGTVHNISEWAITIKQAREERTKEIMGIAQKLKLEQMNNDYYVAALDDLLSRLQENS